MLAQAAYLTGVVAKKTFVAIAIGMIALAVGISCALFPPAIPFGIVGLAGLILLWVMPDLAVIPTVAARMLMAPFVFSLISIPVYYALVLPDSPWISLRRIILFSVVGLTLVALSGSSALRIKLSSSLRKSPLLSINIVGYFAAQILATLTSAQPSLSVSDVINVALNWYLPFCAVVLVYDRLEDVKRLQKVMFAGLLVDAILGAIEYKLHRPYLYLALPSWINNAILAQNANAPVTSANTALSGPYRAGSTFMVPLSWAEMAMMLSPIALHFALSKARGERVLGIAALGGAIASLYFSGSRGGYGGFMAGCFMYALARCGRHAVLNRKSLFGPIAGLLFSMVAGVTLGSILFVGRIHKAILGGGARLASDAGRHEQWVLAIPKFLARPLTGYGPGFAGEVVGWVGPGGLSSLDSYIINVMISSGILGLITFTGILLVPVAYCFDWRRHTPDLLFSTRASIACSILGYSVYRTSLNQTENNSLLFVELGMLIAVNASTQRVQTVRQTEPDAKPKQSGSLQWARDHSRENFVT